MILETHQTFDQSDVWTKGQKDKTTKSQQVKKERKKDKKKHRDKEIKRQKDRKTKIPSDKTTKRTDREFNFVISGQFRTLAMFLKQREKSAWSQNDDTSLNRTEGIICIGSKV